VADKAADTVTLGHIMVPQPSITRSGSPGRLGVPEAERSAVARPGRTAAQQVATIGRRHRFGNAR